MAPKRKTTMAISSSGTGLPMPVRTSSGPVAERTRGAAREHPHHPGSPGLVSSVVRTPGDEPHATNSRDGVGTPAGGAVPSKGVVVPPGGGAATSKMPTPAPTARSSQVVRDEQCHPVGDPGRRPGKSPARPSHDEEGQHARRGAGENGGQQQGRDRAPSNMAEEGRKYPGEDAGADTDSTDDDAAALTKKGRCRNRKRKGKAVLAVKGSDDTGSAKKAKAGYISTFRQGEGSEQAGAPSPASQACYGVKTQRSTRGKLGLPGGCKSR
nr:mucin-1-like [Aegilops tauschii subsp. strangulata]